jgi:NhaP-type Na+/H+ or K+/H+ antiporter
MSKRQTRTSEGGSVISFIVIGVVLAAIVVGGIYVVQKRGENAPVATSPSPSPTASTEQAPPAVSSPSPTPGTGKSPSSPSTKGGTLPSTGPSDDLMGAVGFAILLGVIIAYLRSYKFRFGSLRG